MNPNNYTSLELSQRLAAAGIVLYNTDFRWATHTGQEWELIPSNSQLEGWITSYPAANLSELWREFSQYQVHMFIEMGDTKVWVEWYEDSYLKCSPAFTNISPCDALAELLIWVKGEK